MGGKIIYERFVWFHIQVKAGRHPNARDLSRQFEISPRTAQRDVEFMRDRIGAPLLYDRDRRGYRYLDASYELPPQWFSEDNVMALALAVRLSSSVPDEKIKHNLCALLTRMLGKQEGRELCFEDVARKISVKNIEYSKVDGSLFHYIVTALFKETPLAISYYSPHTDELTMRAIMPLHLLHYMGSWHLIAFCTKRNDIRDFAISRIRSAESREVPFELPGNLPDVKEYIRRNFGLMQGGETFEVQLLFSPSVADWINEQVWDPRQETSVQKDGSLLMRFPAADLREIKRRILAHGADVKVLSPGKLVQEIKKEIVKMARRY